MKYLSNYRIFESNSPIPEDTWEDIKDIIQFDILDIFNISNDLVSESIPGKSSGKYLEPELHIRINERMDNDEPHQIMKACRDLHKRVFALTGLFIDVRWSSQQINIMLNDYPNHYTIIRDFNLREKEDDNIYNSMSGGLCDYDTAIKIMDYLNGFYRFIYDSDKLQFSECYDVVDGVDLVFSLPKFSKERWGQLLCFKFLIDKVNYNPIFVFNTGHVDSTLIRIRRSYSSWTDISNDLKMIEFLESFRDGK